MSGFQPRQGLEQITTPGAPSRFVPVLSWRPAEVKQLFFLTPLEQVAQARMHCFVRTVTGEHGGWRMFMCRKDPAWLPESNGACELCDRIGHQAKERLVTLALELEMGWGAKATIDSIKAKTRQVTKRDGSEVAYPQVGLVVQANANFFRPLWAISAKHELTRHSFTVSRRGYGKDTSFDFEPVQGIPDLQPFRALIPDLRDVLEELGSAGRYARELQQVRAEDQPRFDDHSEAGGDPLDEEFEQLRRKLRAERDARQ